MMELGKYTFVLVTWLTFPLVFQAQGRESTASWNFAVSGDSRNCGNVIMPSIAAGAKKDGAAFYWHLGDLRATYGPDEDYKAEPQNRGHVVDKTTYQNEEWPDFIQNQVTPFDPLPFFLGIGNHETAAPKTRSEFTQQFK